MLRLQRSNNKIKMKQIKVYWLPYIIISCAFLTTIIPSGGRAGLRTGFTKVIMKDLIIGHIYNITEVNHQPLVIENTGGGAITLKIEPVKPRHHELDRGYESIPDISWLKIKQGAEGGAKCMHGYSEIPDDNWLYFERDEIEIKADSTARIKIFLSIPDEEKYYNQHWAIIPRIADKSKKGGSIDPVLFPKFFIETESKKNIKEKPSGLTGIKPSKIEFHHLPFDIALEIGKFSIYNNDSKTHEYKIAPAANYNGFKKPWLSSSYNWLPDPQWIIISKNAVKIAAGRSQEISLKAIVPKRFAYKDWNWEEILLITPDNGPPEFVRVQISTARE